MGQGPNGAVLNEETDRFLEGEEAVSTAVPSSPPSQPPPLLEWEAVFEPLGIDVLGRPLDGRLDEILRLLNARD